MSEVDEDEEVSNNLGADDQEESKIESQHKIGKGKTSGKGKGKGKKKDGKAKKGSAAKKGKKGKKGISQTEVKKLPKADKWFHKDSHLASSDNSKGQIEL